MNGVWANRLSLRGVILAAPIPDHEIMGETFYRLYLSVPRLSGAADELPVIFSGRLFDPRTAQAGMPVRVEGQIRSYKKVIDGRNRLILVAFARELSLDETEGEINQVTLQGTLLRDPVHRMTPLGREIADLLVCVPRLQKKTDCLPCIAWGRNARYASTLKAGEAIRISGRMQSRDYQKRHADGTIEERMALEVSIAALERVPEADAPIGGHEPETRY